MTVKKICVIGMGQTGLPIAVAIAIKCPEIKVTVVYSNPEDVFLLNTKQIPGCVGATGTEDMLRKCHNKNLYFTSDEKSSIKSADMIFITSQSKLKTVGEEKGRILDLSQVEDAALMIATHADTNKIVVENSAIPLRTSKCMKNTLQFNSQPGVKFQVLSNPEFYEEGNPIQDLLHPDRILIGSDPTPEGLAAAKELASIYERWVDPSNIIMRENWTLELAKISSSAFAAQRMTNIFSLAAICEETRTDIKEIVKIMSLDSRIASGFLETNLGRAKMINSVINLIYICESLNLQKVADYWRGILEMNNFHKKRFFNQLLWSLNQTAWNRKIAVLGFSYFKDSAVTEGSAAIDLCQYLLKEHAMVSIYDPKVTQDQVLKSLMDLGCDACSESLESQVTVSNDPYRAVVKSQVIIICRSWKEFLQLDYERILHEMVRPAYLFDCGNFLPHEELLKIGFKVYTIGKYIENS